MTPGEVFAACLVAIAVHDIIEACVKYLSERKEE